MRTVAPRLSAAALLVLLSSSSLLPRVVAFASPSSGVHRTPASSRGGDSGRYSRGRGRPVDGGSATATRAFGGDGNVPSPRDDFAQEGGGGRRRRSPPAQAVPKKPRLALALEMAIRFVARTVFVRSCDYLDIDVRASSNMSILRGDVDSLTASGGGCTFRLGLLSLRRFRLHAQSGLHLGCLPLFLPLSPFVFWRLRGLVWYAALLALLLPSSRPALRSAWARLRHAMGARPSTVDFSMTVSEDDVARSLVLRFGLRTVLRSLVENSVVGAAAALVDDARGVGNKEGWGRGGGDRGRGFPLLPGGGRVDASDAMALFPKDDSRHRQQQQQQGLTSALLSATTFDLKKASFKDGRIILQAEAKVPNEEDVVPGKKRALPFTIRAKLEPASSPDVPGGLPRQEYCHALGFANPDCRLNTNPLTAGTMLGRLIPDVLWLPLGTGVAVPFGRNCRIHRAEIAPDKDSNGREIFRIDGSLTAFAITEDDAWE